MTPPAAPSATLAADAGRRRCVVPLLDLFWSMMLFFYVGLVVWLIVVVLTDVFRRDDMPTGAKVGWTVLVFLFPLIGSLVYLATHRRSEAGAPRRHPEDRDLWRVESAQQSMYVPNFH
jgi:hypothetical protein